jgi:hypothetical protein
MVMCTLTHKLLMACGQPPIFEYSVIALTLAVACMILLRPR